MTALVWLDGEGGLVVTTEVGPFDPSHPGQANFTTVSWPDRRQSLLFSVPTPWGTAVTGDGTIYWLEDDGIWTRSADTGEVRHLATIEDATRVTGGWTVTSTGILVMRDDLGNLVERYPLADGAPVTILPPDGEAYEMWSSTDGQAWVVTRASVGETARFVIYHADGRSAAVDSGINLPLFGWLANGGTLAVYQEFNESFWARPVDGSSAPTRIEQLPVGVDAFSAPSKDGLVAYAGGGTGPSTVCFADNLPSEALP